MKIGCCTLAENYESLVQIGYDYIELSGYQVMLMNDGDFNRVAKKIKNGRIPCRGFNDYCKENLAIVGESFDPIQIKEYAEKIVARGVQLGIHSIGIGAPAARQLPVNFDKAIADKQAMQFLRITSQVAAQYNILVLFEAVHKGLCDYANNTAEALRIVQNVSLPNLKLVLDFHHMNVMGEDLSDFSYVMPYVHHLHICHRGVGNMPEYLTEKDRQFCQSLMQKVYEYGYDGSISVEAMASNFAAGALENYQVLKAACLRK